MQLGLNILGSNLNRSQDDFSGSLLYYFYSGFDERKEILNSHDGLFVILGLQTAMGLPVHSERSGKNKPLQILICLIVSQGLIDAF